MAEEAASAGPASHAAEEVSQGLPEYAMLLAARHAAHANELRGLIRELWGGQTLRVLDVACGDGFYAEAFDAVLGLGSRITAVDLSPAFLTWAANCLAAGGHRVVFSQADAERLPFGDGAFDLVWCAQSLISLPDPMAALAEMRRVVRPKGTVGILENDRLHEMQLPWPVDLEMALRAAETRSDGEAEEVEKSHAGRKLESLLRDAGLTPDRRITLTIDRRSPLPTADDAFVQAYLQALVRRTAGVLAPNRWSELKRLSEPGSPDYLPAQPDFWMTWTDVIVLAVRD